jgi:hypothetical protein
MAFVFKKLYQVIFLKIFLATNLKLQKKINSTNFLDDENLFVRIHAVHGNFSLILLRKFKANSLV